MKLSCVSAAAFVFASPYLQTAQAIPAWDMFTSRQEIGEIVPGTTLIHAYGPLATSRDTPYYLRSSAEPGVEANATVASWEHPLGPPSRFFVSKGALHQITNHTHILYANLVNATTDLALRDSSPTPMSRPAFRLRFTKERSDLIGGSWGWFTSMLQFRLGNRNNYGVFYKCIEPVTGETSIYVPLNPGRTPDGCEIQTFKSYTIRSEHP